MIVKIRKGMFETNSSSSHSFTIEKGVLSEGVLTTIDGTCVIFPGEFGWEIEEFNDATTKASYCLTYAKNKESEEYLEMLRKVIKEQMNGLEVKFVSGFSSFWPWGYIDHQSFHKVEEIFKSEDNLRNFIFNPKSVLRTDNDNH